MNANNTVLHSELDRSMHPKVDALKNKMLLPSELGIPLWMVGPCSVESEEQIHRIAASLATMGVKILRGGVFKPRTSPYAFQGYGFRALQWMRQAADAHSMWIVTEVLSEVDAEKMRPWIEMAQVGSRNMHNYALLRAVGAMKKPVLLKRGMAATIEEWLLAAEYLLLHGAPSVLFCERGIRSFDSSTRNMFDVGAIALMAKVYGLPVIADPSHASGREDLVLPLAQAALAAGALGVMIETHDAPSEALSDGAQAIHPKEFGAWLRKFSSMRSSEYV